jgi:galacturan 1,4-alpha-galacturonidase
VFPEDQNYWIGTKLNPVIYDVTVEWKGVWTVLNLSKGIICNC